MTLLCSLSIYMTIIAIAHTLPPSFTIQGNLPNNVKAEQMTGGAIFEERGKIILTKGDAHIVTYISLKEVTLNSFTTLAALENLLKNDPNDKADDMLHAHIAHLRSTAFQWWADIVSLNIETEMTDFLECNANRLTAGYLASPDSKGLVYGFNAARCDQPNRHTRQAIFGVGLILEGIAIGYMETQITSIIETQRGIIHTQGLLVTGQKALAERTVQLQKNLVVLQNATHIAFSKIYRHREISEATTITIGALEDAMAALATARAAVFDVTLLRADQMKVMLAELSDKAAVTGDELAIDDVSDLSRCKSSFLVDDNLQLNFLAHIPVGSSTRRLSLYKFSSLPAVSPSTGSYIGYSINKPFLAVKQDPWGSFRALSQAEIDTCISFSSVRACYMDSILYSSRATALPNDQHRCLFALRSHNSNDAAVSCPIEEQTIGRKALAIEDNVFAIYSSTPTYLTIKCPITEDDNRNAHPEVNVRDIINIVKFTLRRGCSAENDWLDLDASTHIDIAPARALRYYPDADLFDKVHAATEAEINAMLAIGSLDFDRTTLEEQVLAANINGTNGIGQHHFNLSSNNFGTILIAVLIAIAIGLGIWILYNQARKFCKARNLIDIARSDMSARPEPQMPHPDGNVFQPPRDSVTSSQLQLFNSLLNPTNPEQYNKNDFELKTLQAGIAALQKERKQQKKKSSRSSFFGHRRSNSADGGATSSTMSDSSFAAALLARGYGPAAARPNHSLGTSGSDSVFIRPSATSTQESITIPPGYVPAVPQPSAPVPTKRGATQMQEQHDRQHDQDGLRQLLPDQVFLNDIRSGSLPLHNVLYNAAGQAVRLMPEPADAHKQNNL